LLKTGEAFGGGGPPADEDEFDEIEAPDEEETEHDSLMD
jgi:hypothetical protein